MRFLDQETTLASIGTEGRTARDFLRALKEATLSGDTSTLPFSNGVEGFGQIEAFAESFDKERRFMPFDCTDREIDHRARSVVLSAKIDTFFVLSDGRLNQNFRADLESFLNKGLGYEDAKDLGIRELELLIQFFEEHGEAGFIDGHYHLGVRPMMNATGLDLPGFDRLFLPEDSLPETHDPAVVYRVLEFIPPWVILNISESDLQRVFDAVNHRDELMRQVTEAARNDQDELGMKLAGDHAEACHNLDLIIGSVLRGLSS